jgi:hypothetical protein
LNAELRKGVSAQGNLAVNRELLLLAGGNQVSPAPYRRETGECLAPALEQGQPKANAGQFAGVFRETCAIVGGRILYSAPENVATKGSFSAVTRDRTVTLCFGGVPPAWDEKSFVFVNFKHGKIACADADKVAARIESGFPENVRGRRPGWNSALADAFAEDGAVRWATDLDVEEGFEALSLAVAPNAVVAVVQGQDKFRAQPEWLLVALDPADGKVLERQRLPGPPLPGGLLVDRDGQAVVALLDGGIVCHGAQG